MAEYLEDLEDEVAKIREELEALRRSRGGEHGRVAAASDPDGRSCGREVGAGGVGDD